MKKNILLVLRIIIGLIFIISAYTKLITPGIIEIILVDHGIAANREVAAIFVRILIALEFSLGILFFQQYLLKRVVIPASLIFLTGFTVYLVYTGYILGDTQNCGCFGTTIEMSPLESIIKNIFLIAAIVWLFINTGKDSKGFVLPLAMIVIPVGLVFLIAPIKTIDNFKFAEYTEFVGRGRVDLSEGDKLLAVYNTECDHCQDLAKEISSLKKNSEHFPEFYALLFTEGDVSVDSFKTITGFDFPYYMINVSSFFDLIGTSPPRIYWLENGRVKEIWDKDFLERIRRFLQ